MQADTDKRAAAMLRELRDWVAAQLAQCRRQRYEPYWNGTIIAFQQVVAEIDRLLAAKPAPEPAAPTAPEQTQPAPAAGPSSSGQDAGLPRLATAGTGEAGSTPAGPLTSLTPAADEARIAGSPAHVALWDAINAVVCASGGNAGCTSVARQRAVVEVESAVRAIMRKCAARTTQVVHRRQVTQTGEHFCETQCEERKRLLACAEKVESDRNHWRDQVIGAREIVDAAPDESLGFACATLVARAEKAKDEATDLRAEVERLTGLLDDATSTAATQADDIDDLRARLAAAEQQLAAASKFPKGFVPGRVERDDELPQWLSDMIEHSRKGRRDQVAIATIRLAVINLAERALAQEAGRG